MSLKPPKKGDLNKGWMKQRRDKFIKIQPEYHLIVSEGTDTEPQYFEAIKNEINRNFKDRIQLNIHGEGDNTLNLLQRARTLAEQSPNGYRHVWLVYDTDDFPADHINRTAEICKQISNAETQYHAIWSNQCIELWYLLHFSYFHSDIHRTEYWPKLSDRLTKIGAGIYWKGRPDMFAVLRPYMDTAIAYAKKLDAENEGKTPANSAPGTKLYELIQTLRAYLIES